jgi:ribonuclease HI
VVGDLVIDNSIPWRFFDRACQGPSQICSLGLVLFLSNSHYILAKVNLGSRINNVEEFKVFLYFLKATMKKGIKTLQVFGDLTLTIKWMKDQIQIHNLGLLPPALHLKELASHFQVITFDLIYQENNTMVDSLSKEGITKI